MKVDHVNYRASIAVFYSITNVNRNIYTCGRRMNMHEILDVNCRIKNTSKKEFPLPNILQVTGNMIVSVDSYILFLL